MKQKETKLAWTPFVGPIISIIDLVRYDMSRTDNIFRATTNYPVLNALYQAIFYCAVLFTMFTYNA